MNLPLNAAACQDDPHATARFHMIEQQIRPWNVLDAQVLAVLGQVRRERFVPPARRAQAFADLEIPLLEPTSEAMARGWCMLAPRIEARTLQDLELSGKERVLEIGSGSGHMAALLAACAREVLTLEIEAMLARLARANLHHNEVPNARVEQLDGADAAALAGLGRFDAIVLSGSVAEVPAHLLDLLEDGGRLAAVVGQAPVMRFTLVRREGAAFVQHQPWDTVTARLEGFAEPARFRF